MTDRRPAGSLAHSEIQDRVEFAASLAQGLDAMHRFMHAAREWSLAATIDGCSLYPEGDLPYAFQAASQYERPRDFQQSLFDMLRVIFDPDPPGTFLLNGNYGLLLDAVPVTPFRLVYLSEIGRPGESVADLKERVLDARCVALGLDGGIGPLFGAVCVGQGSLFQQARVCLPLFGAGFSVTQALGEIAREAGIAVFPDTVDSPGCHMGFAIDPALGDRARVSLWRFCGRAAVH